MKKIILSLLGISLLAVSCSQSNFATHAPAQPVSTSTKPSQAPPEQKPQLTAPLPNALSRITKKPFGIYITPQNSPVQPERFKGYHTGVDFETLPEEQNIDVPVAAVCTGKLLMKKWATGYGGVAVQACTLGGSDITVIYGHLNIGTINLSVADTLTAGEQFAVLGKGYSQQTDGERKHLHLGIHKGTSVNILGYVQNQSDLSGWLDAQKYLE